MANRLLKILVVCLLADALPSEGAAIGDHSDSSAFSLSREPSSPRDEVWPPLLSFFLPGADQWWEGQTQSAATYTGIAAIGLGTASMMRERQRSERDSGNNSVLGDLSFEQRSVALGLQTYQAMGGFSAYHSFRTAVRTWQPRGRYGFLTHEEEFEDLLAAPFHFEYLTRKTTLIPLGVGFGLVLAIGELADPATKRQLTGSDVFFSGAYSFNAGTHEEAVFRGWLMPLCQERFNNFALANTAQAAIFAAAHMGTVSVPLPQLLLGGYLGYLTRERGWSLGEAIFVHTWWDVITLIQAYHFAGSDPDQKQIRLTLPVIDTAF